MYKNVKINVYDNGKLVLSRKKLKVAPAEMETVKLSADIIKNATDLKFVLEEEK